MAGLLAHSTFQCLPVVTSSSAGQWLGFEKFGLEFTAAETAPDFHRIPF